jgi:Rad3-related DNA helicase
VSGKTVCRIDVRAFAEYLCRAGDLGQAAPAGPSAREGAKAHRELQAGAAKARGLEAYRAEVPLARTFPGERLDLELSGRADGVYEAEGLVRVEEIKSTRRPLDGLAADGIPAHRVQLELYGWLLCLEEGREAVGLDLVYVRRADGGVRTFPSVRTRAELDAAYAPAVAAYLAWLDGHEGCRLDLAAELEAWRFPFPAFRAGQREAASFVFRAVRDRKVLFLEAPTGLGKTAAVLYPALKALGRGFGAKVFFLTAKNSGAAAAEAALAAFGADLPHLRWISLTAKAKICFLAGDGAAAREAGAAGGEFRPPCDPALCPYARGYYGKLAAAERELFAYTAFDRARIEALARRHEVCPFELSLDLSVHCDAVVGDYNYAFDSAAKLKRFFAFGRTDYVLLVDEAHNLVERARSMFSAALSKRRVLVVRRAAAPAEKPVLSALNAALLAARKAYAAESEATGNRPAVALRVPAGVAEAAAAAVDGFDARLEAGAVLSPAVLDLYWDLARAGSVLDRYDAGYRTVVDAASGGFELDFRCVDPAPQLEAVLADQRAAVLFSGTLAPERYFVRLVAPNLKPDFVSLPSPFAPDACARYRRDGLSTRWKDRGPNAAAYAAFLLEVFAAAPGNLIVFSPSFAFQDALLAELAAAGWPGAGLAVQPPQLSAEGRERFLAAFAPGSAGARGFAVLGGSFAESVDLVGDRLVGAVVFGVGLPQVNVLNDAYRDYFESACGDGYRWAYLYPGLNRVLQAAGRVIRSESDRGFVCLVDERWADGDYRRLLPEDWELEPLRAPGDFARASAGRPWAAPLAEPAAASGLPQ